jgi:hypothetical protein
MVFEYLNKTFGKLWQKEIKPSVLGFEKWKKKKAIKKAPNGAF